ncbi:MAG: L,D-transpeptidase family protein [Actinomycetota bacterium]
MKAGMLTRRFQRFTWIAGITCFLLIVSVAGSAAAVRREALDGRVMLKGFEVGGVALDGLSFEAARERLNDAFDRPLDRSLSVNLDGRPLMTTTPRQLGASTNVEEVYRLALQQQREMSPIKRLWYRITGMAVGSSLQVQTVVQDQMAGEFIARIVKQVNRPPQDASFALSGGGVLITPEVPGFALDEQAARRAVDEALQAGAALNLSGKPSPAAVTKDSFKDIIVVRVGENKLYHYEGARLRKVYDVATGLPRYPTPIGRFQITEKRFRPTWVNPAKGKGQWGENLPARIGPGPGNPLGTRAMNINSKGIRIHGTSTDASLGFNASHGCIRMKMSEVEELFDQLEVGTPVMIVRSGPLRVYQPSATPTLEQLIESDGAVAAPPVPVAPPAVPVPVPAATAAAPAQPGAAVPEPRAPTAASPKLSEEPDDGPFNGLNLGNLVD